MRSPWLMAGLAIALTGTARADPEDVIVPELEELEQLERLAPQAEAPPELELLVFSASRVPVSAAEAPATLSVITADDIQLRGATTLVEALRGVPELDITRDVWGFYHVAIRGRRVDSEVLVQFDGERLNDFYDGRIIYDVPAALIDRIEVIRGPGSALYGTNAFAGVISVYSRRGLGAEAIAMIRSGGGDVQRFETGSLHGGVYWGGKLGRTSRYALTVEGYYTDGPRLVVLEDSLTRNRYDPTPGAPPMSRQTLACLDGIEACPESAFTRSDGRAVRGLGRIETSPGLVKDDSLSFLMHGLTQARGPFIGEYDTFGPDGEVTMDRVFGSLSYDMPLRSWLRLAAVSSAEAMAVDRLVQATPDGFKEQAVGGPSEFPDGQLKSIKYQEAFAKQELRAQIDLHERSVLTLGAEVEYMKMTSYRMLTNFNNFGQRQEELDNYLERPFPQHNQSRTVLGGYIEDVLRLPWGFRMVVGGRYDRYSDFGTAFSPRSAVVWRRGPIGAKLFYGGAFRAPTFEELYDESQFIDLGGYVGNPDLEASRVRTGEAGVSYLSSFGPVQLSVAASGFMSRIEDSIDKLPYAGTSNFTQNSSDIDTHGAAGELRVDLWRRLRLGGNVSWHQATSHYVYDDVGTPVMPDIDTTSELHNVPSVRANATASAALTDKLRLGTLLEWGARRKNNQRAPLEELHLFDFPPYHLLHAFLAYEGLPGGLTLRVVGENLTDQQVADEPLRGSRMPQGVPRDRFRLTVGLSAVR